MKKFIVIPYPKYMKYKQMEEDWKNQSKKKIQESNKEDESLKKDTEQQNGFGLTHEIPPPGIPVDSSVTEELITPVDTDEEKDTSEELNEVKDDSKRKKYKAELDDTKKKKKPKLTTLWEGVA